MGPLDRRHVLGKARGDEPAPRARPSPHSRGCARRRGRAVHWRIKKVHVVISADGIAIAYDRVGEGPPVILVAGAFGYPRYSRAFRSPRGWLDSLGLAQGTKLYAGVRKVAHTRVPDSSRVRERIG